MSTFVASEVVAFAKEDVNDFTKVSPRNHRPSGRYYFTDPEDRKQRLKGKLFDQILQSFLMKSRSLGFIPTLRGSGYGLETTMWMMNNGVTLIPELEDRKGRELGSNGLRSNSFALHEDTWA